MHGSPALTPHGFLLWWSTLRAMVLKEWIILARYPVELVASFLQVFLMIAVFTLAVLMFTPAGANAASEVGGIMVYGFILFIFMTETLWSIGYNVRREQKQGTLEQLYLSPASKSASLVSRVVTILVITGCLACLATLMMSLMLDGLPVHHLPLALFILAFALAGTFGVGFVFAALALWLRETVQTLATLMQFTFMVVCAPFYSFAVLPDWLRAISRAIPLSYGVDAFRSTLMGYPDGFPELAPIGVELGVVTVFGSVMPFLGLGFYRWAEQRARRAGRLSEY